MSGWGGAWAAVACLYAVVTLAMTTPFIDLRTLGTATFEGDGRLVVWTLAWGAHALVDRLPLFDANIYYPAPQALAHTEHMFTLGLLSAPIQVLTHNPVLAFGVLWLLAFWTNAVAAHLLAFRLTGRHDAALVGGLIYGWSYFRVLHLAHLQLQWTAWLPLGLVLLQQWSRSSSPVTLLQAVLVSLAQILTSWYMAVLTVLLNAGWVCWTLARRAGAPLVPRLAQLALAGGVGVLVVLPFVRPYLRVIGPGSVDEARAGSADLAAYVTPPQSTFVGGLLEAHSAVRGPSVWGEQAVFLGWLALALATLGGAIEVRRMVAGGSRPRTTDLTFFLLLGGLAFWLSLGPLASGVGLFDLLTRVPGLSLFRAPARFAILVLLAVGMLAAAGAAGVCAFVEQRWGARAARALVAVLGLAMLGEWYPTRADIPRADVRRMPAIYQVLARLPSGPVISLPDYRLRPEWFRRADYLLYASFHWRPIVNGYGRSEPPEYLSIVEQLSTFPSEASTTLARALGVRYVVAHSDLLDPPRPIEIALDPASVRLVAQVGPDYLFEVVARSPAATNAP